MLIPKYILAEKREIEEKRAIKEQKSKIVTADPFDKVFHRVLKVLEQGEISKIPARSDFIKENSSIYDIISWFVRANNEDKEAAIRLLTVLHRRKLHGMLATGIMTTQVLNVCLMNLFWIRDVESWEPKSYNANKQFSSLVRHLFCKYDIPTFLDSAWGGSGSRSDWFIHLGNGGSVRALTNVPIQMTKRMAHEFMQTPEGYTIDEALKRAHILSIDGSDRFAFSVLSSKVGTSFNNNEFWTSVFSLLIRTPMLDPDLIPSIIDYIDNQKFGENAPHPGWSAKGRTAQSLMSASETWHRQISKSKKSGYKIWKSTGIPGFKLEEGTVGNKNFKKYEIVELLNSKELSAEGRIMKHCVASYDGSCLAGKCSIWSMTVNDEKTVTIEVRNKQIIQAKAKSNLKPTQKDWNVMHRWASSTGLDITKFA